MNTAFRWSKRIFCFILGMVLFSLMEITPVYSGEKIELTLRNFYAVKPFHGKYEYSQISEVGIPAGKHILIIKSSHCLDDATDKNGNTYFFYMVDHVAGMKALICTAELDPVKELDDMTREFYNLVKQEVTKDGGIEALIRKFKKTPREREHSLGSNDISLPDILQLR